MSSGNSCRIYHSSRPRCTEAESYSMTSPLACLIDPYLTNLSPVPAKKLAKHHTQTFVN